MGLAGDKNDFGKRGLSGGTRREAAVGQRSLRPWQHGALFLAACAALISRRPDAVFHAQFYAEDGRTWFADAYNFGWWNGLWLTNQGYHHVFMRLGAALALLAPLAQAPLVMNLIAIALLAVPVNLLCSARSAVWGSVRLRGLLALAFLAMPNTREMLNNISQAQWPLTLCAFLVLVAEPPISTAGKLFDLSILLLCGLTGPQCIFLLPLALFFARRRPHRWYWTAAAALALASAVQIWPLLQGGLSSRHPGPLGATPQLLVRIVSGQVFVGSLLGQNGLGASENQQVFVFLLCVAVLGVGVAVYCLIESTEPLRLFVLLTTALFAVSLISPTTNPPTGISTWQWLATVGGIRYWYFPCLAFTWLLLEGVRGQRRGLRAVTFVLLCVLCVGATICWRIPALPDLHFAAAAQRFAAAPAGTVVSFPQNPEGWTMQLVKRAPAAPLW